MSHKGIPMRIRFFLSPAFAALILFFPIHSIGATGDMGSMDIACSSPDIGLHKLCQIVNEKFEAPQDSYVHLGGDFYIVSVTNTGRVAQGLYVANVKSGGLNHFGGSGLTQLGKVLLQENGSLWIRIAQSSMTHGEYWEAESLLELRNNPVTKTPFLISHDVRTKNSLSEEMQSFCSERKNNQSAKCRGLGETVHLDSADMARMQPGYGARNEVYVQKILAAHQKALRVYRRNKFEGKNPFQYLEEASIWGLLDAKPTSMSNDQYVNILNDYAFFAYQYGEGRNDLAIEILDKVIRISPERSVAYLNMAEALEHLAKFGSTQYSTMPLDEQTIESATAAAKSYREKYQSMRAQAKRIPPTLNNTISE